MALYTDIATIGEAMAEHNARFWQVFDSDGNKVAENMKTTDNTAEDSYSRLHTFISKISGDYVNVRCFTKVPNKDEAGAVKTGNVAGQSKFTYRVMLNPAMNSPLSGNRGGIAGFGGAGIGEIIDLNVKLARMESQREIDKLERKIEGLEAKGSGFEDKLFGLAEKYLMNAKVTTDLRNAKPVEEIKTEAKEQNIAGAEIGLVGSTVNQIADVMKGDTGELLESLRYYAKRDPEGFKGYATGIIEAVKTTKAEDEKGK